MNVEFASRIVFLFAVLFIVGSLFCLPLFKWQFANFFSSALWTKIIWWFPIFIVFMLILFVGSLAAMAVGIVLILLSVKEFILNRGSKSLFAICYMALFTFATAHLLFFIGSGNYYVAIEALIVICFASVASDVCAFFAGTYIGKHHLPAWLNDHKSWEGVEGQIAGALIGYGFVNTVVGIDGYWTLAIIVGIASAFGDLCNSAAKRSLNIKDWGNTIPGHGGVLDRFASLSFAIAAAYWVLKASDDVLVVSLFVKI